MFFLGLGVSYDSNLVFTEEGCAMLDSSRELGSINRTWDTICRYVHTCYHTKLTSIFDAKRDETS